MLATVTDYTRFYQLPAPAHPLLTLIDLGRAREQARGQDGAALLGPVVPQLYTIFLKRGLNGPLYYGHQAYDFREGVLGFSAPGQLFQVDETSDISQLTGWMLVFHPDLLSCCSALRLPSTRRPSGWVLNTRTTSAGSSKAKPAGARPPSASRRSND